jgi:filamentous hemagglutinin
MGLSSASGRFLQAAASSTGEAAAAGVAARTPLWTSTKSKTAVENAFSHWQRHGAEFPEFQNAKQYVEGAKDFFRNPPSGTLTKVRPNGDKLFYNPANNSFGVQTANGAPRTMFRPTDGINYWNKQ